jgi:hypothetical protein
MTLIDKQIASLMEKFDEFKTSFVQSRLEIPLEVRNSDLDYLGTTDSNENVCKERDVGDALSQY